MRAMRFLCVCFLIYAKTEVDWHFTWVNRCKVISKDIVYNKNSKTLDIFGYYSYFKCVDLILDA